MDVSEEISELLDIESDLSVEFEIKPKSRKKIKEPKPVKVILTDSTLEGIAQYIKEKPCKSVVVLFGAGVSTRSGIPDVRTPASGLYYKLRASQVPNPQAVFEIRTFKKNPKILYRLLYPYIGGNFKPTFSHYFVTLLQKKKILLRNYTQNADDLEKVAGVKQENLGQINGTFNKFRCVLCEGETTARWIKGRLDLGLTPECECGGIIKPKMYFYGEALPQQLCHNMAEDMKKCDLLMVMGTSLSDQPVASMPNFVGRKVPRLVINGTAPSRSLGFDFSSRFPRDVFWEGDCEDGCKRLADLLGWADQLYAIKQDSLNSNIRRSTKYSIFKPFPL